jgi:selenocysteine-specific elongation factor
VAIVDVPGHEMFVRNMVAGATGIDAAIFVMAADEGVMPQTVEHLDVLRSLRVAAGVVALTKVDKVSPQQVAQASAEAKLLLGGTLLAEAAVVPVSSVTGEGLPDLVAEIARIAAAVPVRPVTGVFRLPIDRVFTIKGAGTVVTGTVVSGSLQVGARVTCLPQGRALRARALHVHNQAVEQIVARQRAALNLAEIEKEEIQRGDVLTSPGALSPTLMLDARIELTARAPRPLSQRTRVRVHHGTREVMARVVLLEAERLPPGASALAQLRLEAPLVALGGDPFVVRSYSPMQVIGGGTIIDPHPPKRRHAAGAAEVMEREALGPDAIIAQALDRAGARGMELGAVSRASGLPPSEAISALEGLRAEGRARSGRRDLWFSSGAIEEAAARLISALAELHAREPLRPFASLPRVLGAASVGPDEREGCRLALDSLVSQGLVIPAGDRVRLSSHQPQWRGRHAAARERILSQIRDAGLASPPPQELAASCGLDQGECQRVLEALVEAGELHLLAAGIYLHPQVVADSRATLVSYLEKHGKMSIGDARALLGASRKYLLPFLEQLDREGETIRQGDYRVLAKRP